MLPEVDVVSLNCPAIPENYRMIAKDRLVLVKPVAVIVNMSRGEFLNEGDLAEALFEGRISGAGLDVFERDPDLERRLHEMPRPVLHPICG